jgi:putative mRNA 3-end processing factor
MKPKQRRPTHAFVYRAGIGLGGTQITCDATGFPSDLIFLSHARALPPRGPAALTDARAGRRQIVTTEKTLQLLGVAGDKLRGRTLPAAFGRPFNLGGQRIEVVPTGYLPGAASLLCESEGRHLFYAGRFCPEPIVAGVEAFEVRRADAVCIDATFGDPQRVFPPRQQVVAQVRHFVQEAVGDHKTPVLLASPFGALPALVIDLSQAGLALRAHPRIAAVLTRLRSVCEGLPAVPRFTGKLAPGDTLLWPPEARDNATLQLLPDLRLALVAGDATDPAILSRMRIDHGFALTNMACFAEILATLEATGAREVALYHGAAETLAEVLSGRGYKAYALGPPRQMTLPGSD